MWMLIVSRLDIYYSATDNDCEYEDLSSDSELEASQSSYNRFSDTNSDWNPNDWPISLNQNQDDNNTIITTTITDQEPSPELGFSSIELRVNINTQDNIRNHEEDIARLLNQEVTQIELETRDAYQKRFEISTTTITATPSR